MPHLPFLSRLQTTEYLALALSFALLLFELAIRTATLLLPTPLYNFFYRTSRTTFNALSTPYARKARKRERNVSAPIAAAEDFVALCELFGYGCEEHVVQTRDGYLLGVHRLLPRNDDLESTASTGERKSRKVVYLHHGLLMNSEVWICLTDPSRNLPFTLLERGYDVWLGNNRGNKYSKKSLRHSPTSNAFWDFSMDQFAFYDIPDSIYYILATTGEKSLSYIGFSQGTAQAFATLSIHPSLNDKIDVFVALAPAMAPPGLASGIVSSLVKTNPEILFLLFGRRAILSSTTMWSALLYPAIFAWFIDKSLLFLFGWQGKNMSLSQKLAAYPHLYSFTSTKSVVHWFQIIRNSTFQMYDDEVSTPLSLSQGSRYYKVAKFPTRNIRTPIVLLYGGSDSLVDIDVMLHELPQHTEKHCVPKYEHLDFLWARDVQELVFPHVLQALEKYAGRGDSRSSRMKEIEAEAEAEVEGEAVKAIEASTPASTAPLTLENGVMATPAHLNVEPAPQIPVTDEMKVVKPFSILDHLRPDIIPTPGSSADVAGANDEQLDESDEAFDDDGDADISPLTPQPRSRKGVWWAEDAGATVANCNGNGARGSDEYGSPTWIGGDGAG